MEGIADALATAIADIGGGLKEMGAQMWSEMGAELNHLGAQGSHEASALLFRGDAFVMYPGSGGAEQQIEAPQVEAPQAQIEAPQIEYSREM